MFCFLGNQRGTTVRHQTPCPHRLLFSFLSTPHLRKIHKSVRDSRNMGKLAGHTVVSWVSIVKFQSNGRFAFLTRRAGILQHKHGNFFLWIGTLWKSADCNMSFFSIDSSKVCTVMFSQSSWHWTRQCSRKLCCSGPCYFLPLYGL